MYNLRFRLTIVRCSEVISDELLEKGRMQETGARMRSRNAITCMLSNGVERVVALKLQATSRAPSQLSCS